MIGNRFGPLTRLASIHAGSPASSDQVHPSSNFREQRFHLHPRKVEAKALVRAVPESDMAVGRPIDPERERIDENLLVAISGWKAHHEQIAGTDLLASKLIVLSRRAEEVLHRRGPAQHLFPTAEFSSSGNSRNRRNSAGCSINACNPPAIAELVVSWPAVAITR